MHLFTVLFLQQITHPGWSDASIHTTQMQDTFALLSSLLFTFLRLLFARYLGNSFVLTRKVCSTANQLTGREGKMEMIFELRAELLGDNHLCSSLPLAFYFSFTSLSLIFLYVTNHFICVLSSIKNSAGCIVEWHTLPLLTFNPTRSSSVPFQHKNSTLFNIFQEVADLKILTFALTNWRRYIQIWEKNFSWTMLIE